MSDSIGTEGGVSASQTSSTLLTFLIADVRGYTRFTVERGDEEAARLADRFASLCEMILGQHEGRVIELRGDEALCVFHSARNALRGAVALQEALGRAVRDDPTLPLTVGIGLDAGDAVPLRGGYRGGALNLAARLCSIAGGGEIFASETVIGLARKTEGLVFMDRGGVTLKGLSNPVRVMQIGREGELPAELPPLQTHLVTHPTNLPDEPTPFIGRENEILQICRILREPHGRLLTLTGPGGAGKTRLAVQVGTAVLYDFGDGVFFVSLAPISDPAHVPSAIARVLGVREGGGKDFHDAIAEHLEQKHLLLLLDNFEHILDASTVITALLDRCRELHILVTSRSPLRVTREQEYAVLPLTVPPPKEVGDAGSIAGYESVALFIQRARAARATFTLTDENAPAVAEICLRLDGLPLAIELAAARVKLFPPQALVARLTNRLKLLAGGERDRPARHQTLRGAIDWSHSLLTGEEQILFARISVFADSCTFEAAEAVCNGDGSLDLLECLSSLVDKSLIRQEGREESRFSMFETIREYAAERLAQGGVAETIRGAHAQYYLHLAEEAEPELRGPGQAEWFRRLDIEMPNLRLAVQELLHRHEAEAALRLASALFDYWRTRSDTREVRRWLSEGLEDHQGVDPAVRGRALWALGAFTFYTGPWVPATQESAASLLQEALPLLREAGDHLRSARTLMRLGVIAMSTEDYGGADAPFTEALATFRELDDRQGIAIAIGYFGDLALERGDNPAAIRHYEEALSYARTAGDTQTILQQLLSLGAVRLIHGDLDATHAPLEEALRLAHDMGSHSGAISCLNYLGMLALEREEHVVAGERLRDALLLAERHESKESLPATLEAMAALAMATGIPEKAGLLLGAAVELRDVLSVPPGKVWRTVQERTVTSVRELLGEDSWRQTQRDGRAMSLTAAIQYALEGPV